MSIKCTPIKAVIGKKLFNALKWFTLEEGKKVEKQFYIK